MDEDKITKIALEVGLLNYVDNETPRRYFIDGNADYDTVVEFAKRIVQQTIIETTDYLKAELTKVYVNE